MYQLKLGRIITLDPRVLTPNLDGFIPRGKTRVLARVPTLDGLAVDGHP